MSVKSERKKAVKAAKQAEEALRPVIVPPAKAPLPFLWFAEKSAQEINDHNTTCKDPNCTPDIELRFKDKKLVAMVRSHEPKRLYLAEYGSGTARDYQPVYVFPLETGEEIAGAFEKDGTTHCEITGHNNTDQPICLTLLCHNKGLTIVVHKDAPDTISLVCAEPTCQRAIKSDNLLTRKIKLAKRPVAEFPNVFCNYHGLQPSYIVCCHVAHGTEPMLLDRPGSDAVGLAFCSDACDEVFTRVAKAIKAGDVNFPRVNHSMCAGHLNEVLRGRLEQYHQQADANA